MECRFQKAAYQQKACDKKIFAQAVVTICVGSLSASRHRSFSPSMNGNRKCWGTGSSGKHGHYPAGWLGSNFSSSEKGRCWVQARRDSQNKTLGARGGWSVGSWLGHDNPPESLESWRKNYRAGVTRTATKILHCQQSEAGHVLSTNTTPTPSPKEGICICQVSLWHLWLLVHTEENGGDN